MERRAERVFGNCEGVIDLHTQVADGAFNFGMAKQELDGTEIAGPPLDQGRPWFF